MKHLNVPQHSKQSSTHWNDSLQNDYTVLLVPTLSEVSMLELERWLSGFRTLFALVEAGFNSLQPHGGSQPL